MTPPPPQEPGRKARKGDLLTAEAWNALRAESRANRVRVGPSSGLVARRSPEGIDLAVARTVGARIAYAAAGVPARVGSTVGSAAATLQNFDGTDLSDDVEVVVKNFSGSAVASSKFIGVILIGDVWWVWPEEC